MSLPFERAMAFIIECMAQELAETRVRLEAEKRLLDRTIEACGAIRSENYLLQKKIKALEAQLHDHH